MASTNIHDRIDVFYTSTSYSFEEPNSTKTTLPTIDRSLIWMEVFDNAKQAYKQ